MQKNQIFPTSFNCPACDIVFEWVNWKSGTNYFYFRCPNCHLERRIFYRRCFLNVVKSFDVSQTKFRKVVCRQEEFAEKWSLWIGNVLFICRLERCRVVNWNFVYFRLYNLCEFFPVIPNISRFCNPQIFFSDFIKNFEND